MKVGIEQDRRNCKMDPLDDFCSQFFNCSSWPDVSQIPSGNVDNDFPGVCSRENEIPSGNAYINTDFSSGGSNPTSTERECSLKRGRGESSSWRRRKACREKMRRERLNEKFSELSVILEPGRAPKTDKSAILDDAIRILNQLRTESGELRETNEKLLEEIRTLKAEKNELREEKLTLKAEKEKIEQRLKTVPIPPPAGYIPGPQVAAPYNLGPNKMEIYPSYGFVQMWQYIPSSVRDISQDNDLAPTA